MADRIKLGGLWINKTKDGREYLSGRLSPTVKILIFKNDFRSAENQPSHVMYLAPVETEEAAAARTSGGDSFLSSEIGSEPADGDEEITDARPGDGRSAEVRPAASRPASRPAMPAPAAPRRPARGETTGYNTPKPDEDDLDDPFGE